MRTATQERTRTPASAWSGTGVSLSVVVVATGSALQAQRAAQALVSSDLATQFILVSRDPDPAFAATMSRTGAEFVVAPAGCTRAEMCDLGMSRAVGAIVAVRDDVDVGDAAWLDVYRTLLAGRMPATVVETVVMDSQVATRTVLADSSAGAYATLESRARVAAIEMAAAV